MAGQALVLTPEASGSGDGYGSGYGYGYGYGDGYGSGYGDGYGSGDGDGSGYGSGDGYGYGSGDGYGSGSGDGDGSGYGSGYGSGSGYGYGYGDGYGYGYGDGYGSGSGDGDGDGSGYGYGEAALTAYLSHPLVTAYAREEQVTLAWWRSTTDGQSANGGRHMAPAQPGLVHEVQGPLRLCSRHALHASVKPGEWGGDRWWVVALLGPVQQAGDKAGALRRLIVEEVT